MKQYWLLVFLIVIVTACAPKVEVEKALPAEEPIEVPQETEVSLEEPEEILEPNLIEIMESGFLPEEKTIKKNTEIKWLKKDSRNYKIACYLLGERVIQSNDLQEGDSFTYKFLIEGEYTCITVPYGLRSTVTVRSEQPLLSPTGGVIIKSRDINLKGASLTATAIFALVILLFFIYGRKRQ